MPIDLKRIKALFVEEAGTTSSPQPASPGKKPPAKDSAPPVQPPPPAAPDGFDGNVSDVFLNILSQALEKENLPGMDYLEFRQSLKSLEKMAMTEQLRYHSAFAMAQAMGATRQRLLDTIDHYLTILEKEERKFEQALLHQTRERIGNRQEAMTRIDQAIKDKERQIDALRQEIMRLAEEKETQRVELQEATSKIERTKADFIATYTQLRKEIHRDADNLRKYLS
ncbi:MAG: hypothetical protein RLY31_3253 [Bacteroidota bacterium]|jgi:chromosome segregation ATPase